MYIHRIFDDMVWEEILSEGISHFESRVKVLCEMETPKTAAELQQFLCPVNWMRNTIPNYTTLVNDLHVVPEEPQRRQEVVRSGI